MIVEDQCHGKSEYWKNGNLLKKPDGVPMLQGNDGIKQPHCEQLQGRTPGSVPWGLKC